MNCLLLIAALSLGVLLPNSPAQTDTNTAHTAPAASVSTKPVTRCPRHFTKHKDDHGGVWCMDSSGRNYTPENAKAVANMTQKSTAQH
jgi:hypothetical protein